MSYVTNDFEESLQRVVLEPSQKDGRYAYLTGWCDYTGWGCQDGANLAFFNHQPTLDEMKASHEYGHEPDASMWDSEPADLNRWLSTVVPVNP